MRSFATLLLCGIFPAMSENVPAFPDCTGPLQFGRNVNGQYVYWITMVQPSPETIAAYSLKVPSDFTRASFNDLVLEAHTAAEIDIVETASFLEPHANGFYHHNLLVRSSRQYRWKQIADWLRARKVLVNFAPNINKWVDGVVYGRVASEHKGPEALDNAYTQWAKEGQPVPFEQILPKRFLQPGFVRQVKLTSLAFYELCREHSIQSEEELWAKAEELKDQGDKALLAYLMDHDGAHALEKVQKATSAKEALRRASLPREALLREVLQEGSCTCDTPGLCYALMRDLASKNGLDGILQPAVLEALRAGRAKMRNICLLGGSNCGKTFLFKGLALIYRAYERPDGGSYQLAELPNCEIVFLNEFEYDAGARDWMPWAYLKRFLEGGVVPVGRPKHKGGGNVNFSGSAPVFFTAAKEVILTKGGFEDEAETEQMRNRIRYFHLHYQIPPAARQEVLRHCACCTAKFYLEPPGATLPDIPTRLGEPTSSGASSASPAKRPRLAAECIQELQQLKALLDAKVLSEAEFQRLKQQLLSGC